MSHFLDDQIPGFSISPADKPFLGFVQYMGNDVCKKKIRRYDKT